MSKAEPGASVVSIAGQPEVAEDQLPYDVCVWTADAPESRRLVGRAASIVLARAIFTAAQVDFAGNRITLSRGSRVIQDSDSS